MAQPAPQERWVRLEQRAPREPESPAPQANKARPDRWANQVGWVRREPGGLDWLVLWVIRDRRVPRAREAPLEKRVLRANRWQARQALRVLRVQPERRAPSEKRERKVEA